MKLQNKKLKFIISNIFNKIGFEFHFFLYVFKKYKYILWLSFFIFCLLQVHIDINMDHLMERVSSDKFKVLPLFTTIMLFIITSSIAMFVFLYREKKEIDKNIIFNIVQVDFFKMTLMCGFFTIFIVYCGRGFEPKFLSFSINIIIYLLFIVTIISNLNIFSAITIKSNILSLTLDEYIFFVNKVYLGKRITWIIIGLIIFLPIFFGFFFENLVFNYNIPFIPSEFKNVLIYITAVIIVFTIFILIEKIFLIITPHYFLSYISKEIYDTYSGLFYFNNLEKSLDIKIQKCISDLNSRINNLLFASMGQRDFTVLKLFNPELKKSDILIDLYSNVFEIQVKVVLDDSIDNALKISLRREIYDFLPLPLNTSLYIIDEDAYHSHFNKYLNIYIGGVSKILLKSCDFEGNMSLEFFKGYREKMMFEIELEKVDSEFFLVSSAAYNIESILFSELVMKNDLRSIVNCSLLLIEKKNLNYSNITQKYVSLIIVLIIKSIELMHLKVAGYLIKILSSNFPAISIINGLEEFDNNVIKLSNDDIESKVGTLPVLNSELFIFQQHSLEYCFNKTYILLKQYNFESIKFEKEFDDDYLKMLLKKISNDCESLGLDASLYSPTI